ncbi:MAG: glycosyltransferase family 4 protein, partial [Candidatus Helarchaeales archaeon]
SRRFGFFTRWIFSRAKHVVVPNNYLKSLTLNFVNQPSKIHVIPHGMEYQDNELPIPPDLVEIKQQFDIQSRSVLLYVGRLVALKSVDTIIKAVSLLINEGEDVSCLIIGTGPEKKKLEKLISRLGIEKRVIFLGELPWRDLCHFYAIADAFMLLSKNEGVGLVLMEAMQHGVPIVATRVGGIPELVKDGEIGFLVKVGDHEEAARRVKEILRDPEFKKRATIFDEKLLKQRHDLRQNLRKYLELLRLNL